MRNRCEAGACAVTCPEGHGCGCWCPSDDPNDCHCTCYGGRGSSIIVKEGKRKISFKTFEPKIKVISETKFNICTHDLPIGALALILDKYLPNKIVVPAA